MSMRHVMAVVLTACFAIGCAGEASEDVDQAEGANTVKGSAVERQLVEEALLGHRLHVVKFTEFSGGPYLMLRDVHFALLEEVPWKGTTAVAVTCTLRITVETPARFYLQAGDLYEIDAVDFVNDDTGTGLAPDFHLRLSNVMADLLSIPRAAHFDVRDCRLLPDVPPSGTIRLLPPGAWR